MSLKLNNPLTHEEKDELNRLSLAYLGSASKWRKLEKKGKLISNIPGKKDPLIEDGRKISKYYRLDPRQILDHLRMIKSKEDAKKAHKEKIQEIIKTVSAASGMVKDYK